MIKRGSGEFVTTVEDVAGVEHDLTVRFSGYVDPGRCYGPPENCYPPEGEIEIDYTLPAGVEFADTLHEKLEDQAWDNLHDLPTGRH